LGRVQPPKFQNTSWGEVYPILRKLSQINQSWKNSKFHRGKKSWPLTPIPQIFGPKPFSERIESKEPLEFPKSERAKDCSRLFEEKPLIMMI